MEMEVGNRIVVNEGSVMKFDEEKEVGWSGEVERVRERVDGVDEEDGEELVRDLLDEKVEIVQGKEIEQYLPFSDGALVQNVGEDVGAQVQI